VSIRWSGDRVSRLDKTAVGIVLFATVARLWSIGSESLHYDEVYAVLVGSQNVGAILMGDPTVSPHPPLYFFILRLWTAVFGVAEASVRFPSAIFGAVSVALLYLVGRLLFDRRTAVVSAAILAVSSFHLFHSQNARMYSLLSMFTLSSFYFYLRSTSEPNRLELACYTLSSALLLYTHIFGAFVLLAQVGYNATADRLSADARRVGRRRWVHLLVVVAAAYTPLLVNQLRQVIRFSGSGTLISWVQPPTVGTVLTAFLSYIGYQSNTMVLVLRAFPFVVVAGLFGLYWVSGGWGRAAIKPVGRFVTPSEHDDGIYLLLLWIGAIHVVPWILSHLVTPIYFTRVTIGASLAVYLLVGHAVSRLEPSRLRYGVVALLVLSLLIPLPGYYTEHQRDEWDESVGYIESHAAPNATVLLVSDSAESADLRLPFRYYGTRTDLDLRAIGTRNDRLKSQLRSATDESGQVWVVLGRSHSLGAGNVRTLTDLFNRECDVSRNEEFVRITVKSYDCSAPDREGS
jgi:uncharacterized membrane protein